VFESSCVSFCCFRLGCCLDSKNFDVDRCLFGILLIALGCKIPFFLWPKCLGERCRQALFLKLASLDTAKNFEVDSCLFSCHNKMLGSNDCWNLNNNSVTMRIRGTKVISNIQHFSYCAWLQNSFFSLAKVSRRTWPPSPIS
jgi:hypothetical protein